MAVLRGAAVDLVMPCYGGMQAETTFSLLKQVQRAGHLIQNIHYKNHLYLDQARNKMIWECLQEHPLPTHILHLDSDMIWEADVLERLLTHKKPVVGAPYFTRYVPHELVCGHFVKDKGKVVRGQPLNEMPSGLVKVDYIGLGCTLVETRLFLEMREKYQDQRWFRSEESGEDTWFFMRLHEMGVESFIDTDIDIGHISQQVVTREHWNAYKEYRAQMKPS